MADPDLVSPMATQAPVTPAAGNEQNPAQIPESLLKVPAIVGLLSGAPPAISARIKTLDKSDLGKEIVANKDALLAAGFAFYKSIHGDLAVMYNRFHIHGEDIKAADRAGKLQVLAPPYEQVDHALAKKGPATPSSFPGGFASATPQAAPQAGAQAAAGASGPPMAPPMAPAAGGASGALAKRLMTTRLTNMQPGAPTSGASPGAGRLLNSILKPVV